MRSMCVGVAETGHRGESAYADGMELYFFILAVDYTGFLSCRGRRMVDGAWRGGKICRKAAEYIDFIHKMHHI